MTILLYIYILVYIHNDIYIYNQPATTYISYMLGLPIRRGGAFKSKGKALVQFEGGAPLELVTHGTHAQSALLVRHC